MKKALVGVVLGLLIVGIAVLYHDRGNSPSVAAENSQRNPATAKKSHPDEAASSSASTAMPKDVVAPSTPERGTQAQSLGAGLRILMRPEFDYLLAHRPVVATLHTAIESEPRDADWATAKEQEWSNGFSANEELRKYGTPIIECRTTRCEIRLITYGPSDLDGQGWAVLLSKGILGKKADGEQASPSQMPTTFSVGDIENNGATAVILHVQFTREDQH